MVAGSTEVRVTARNSLLPDRIAVRQRRFDNCHALRSGGQQPPTTLLPNIQACAYTHTNAILAKCRGCRVRLAVGPRHRRGPITAYPRSLYLGIAVGGLASSGHPTTRVAKWPQLPRNARNTLAVPILVSTLLQATTTTRRPMGRVWSNGRAPSRSMSNACTRPCPPLGNSPRGGTGGAAGVVWIHKIIHTATNAH